MKRLCSPPVFGLFCREESQKTREEKSERNIFDLLREMRDPAESERVTRFVNLERDVSSVSVLATEETSTIHDFSIRLVR